MALARVHTISLNGLKGHLIDVEVDVRNGLPSFTIVGLPDKAIDESRERVKSAITNSGLAFPTKKIVVNLAPAQIKKEGSWFDLAIAVGILRCSHQIEEGDLSETIFAAELSLNGELKATEGIVIIADATRELGYKQLVTSYEGAEEAMLIKALKITAPKHLEDLVHCLRGEKELSLPPNIGRKPKSEKPALAFEDIKGQLLAKRALIIAVAGQHNILLHGPPGTGKSLLAKATQSLLPPLNFEQGLELTKIYSLSGQLERQDPLVHSAPWRSPHHSASSVSIIGGGANPLPGEITLAHRGILFMDELPEFARTVLESLRQPLEDGYIEVARAKAHIRYPACFMLIAAMNPCPCGFYGDHKIECSCSVKRIEDYRKKISGPIIDRIDMQIKLPRLSASELEGEDLTITSTRAQKMIKGARAKQYQRAQKLNSELDIKELSRYCQLDEEAKKYLLLAVDKLNLSPRAYHKTIKVAQTICDLNNIQIISTNQIAEALQYRQAF